MHHELVAEPTSVNMPFVRDVLFTGGVDFMTVTGTADGPYAFPNFRVASTNFESGVPIMVWRSVGNSHTEFARESAIDELAIAAGRDPSTSGASFSPRPPGRCARSTSPPPAPAGNRRCRRARRAESPARASSATAPT